MGGAESDMESTHPVSPPAHVPVTENFDDQLDSVLWQPLIPDDLKQRLEVLVRSVKRTLNNTQTLEMQQVEEEVAALTPEQVVLSDSRRSSYQPVVPLDHG